MNPTVCFCHGRESGPWGTKIRRLTRVAEGLGCRVVSPDDRDTANPDERVQKLLTVARSFNRPLLLVGSSMGGYVATVASRQLQPAGLFLMAPAVGLAGYQLPAPGAVAGRICIVHGWNDTIVPLANVLAFAREQKASLHILDDTHVLHNSLEEISRLFAGFLAGCLGVSGVTTPSRELIAAL